MIKQKDKIYKNTTNIDSISLVEVLLSILLLTLVIGTVFKIKDNNLVFLEKFSQSQQFSTYVALAISSYTNKIKNENIYLDEVVDFKDDDIRRKLKLIKVIRRDSEQTKNLGLDANWQYTIKTSTYAIDSKKINIYSISIK